MLQIAFYLSCGATACYLWGRGFKREVDSFSSITRVVDFKRFFPLSPQMSCLKRKPRISLLLCPEKLLLQRPPMADGKPLGSVFQAKAEMGYETKLEDDGSGWITKSQNFLFQLKQTPWYLEDSTGRVKVVGAEFADRFLHALKPQFDMSLSEIFDRIERPQQGSKVICQGSLDTGTYLTIIGEAARDAAGNLTIQKPNKDSFRIFSGEGSFDNMVADLKSDYEFYLFCSKIFGAIALAIVVMKGVSFIRRVLRERAENADSDNEETP
ncbi:hypothetical protein Rs2_36382 [Raphanus sativus]|nr:hypothetical protein Rs2_36382 [Raphanus sativus]